MNKKMIRFLNHAAFYCNGKTSLRTIFGFILVPIFGSVLFFCAFSTNEWYITKNKTKKETEGQRYKACSTLGGRLAGVASLVCGCWTAYQVPRLVPTHRSLKKTNKRCWRQKIKRYNYQVPRLVPTHRSLKKQTKDVDAKKARDITTKCQD